MQKKWQIFEINFEELHIFDRKNFEELHFLGGFYSNFNEFVEFVAKSVNKNHTFFINCVVEITFLVKIL